MRNNEFSSHRTARDITLTLLGISRVARQITESSWRYFSSSSMATKLVVSHDLRTDKYMQETTQ